MTVEERVMERVCDCCAMMAKDIAARQVEEIGRRKIC